MPAASTSRITIEPGKRGGKPCVRGLRNTVWDVLGWLGAGMTEDQILDEHPNLEKADFPAVSRRTPTFNLILTPSRKRKRPNETNSHLREHSPAGVMPSQHPPNAFL